MPARTTARQQFRQSFREKRGILKDYKDTVQSQARQRLNRMRKMPGWLRIMKKGYHDYGLKHVCLLLILIFYQFLGALIFYLCEAGAEESMEDKWLEEIDHNRTIFAQRLFNALFNNTVFMYYMPPQRSGDIIETINNYSQGYETQLGIKFSDQKIRWDFWNAMLYAQTICTTIGYGHLYPMTKKGRIFTMLYAIFGIPLVLSILDDLGKLLTKCLKYPWFLVKCACRRLFRYCTKQTLEEIRKLDDEDKEGLAVFDLPIPVAVSIVVAWIFICSATFCIWEKDWDYLVAFYFFFISLSTIGLGDITPTEPKYLLMMFGYIIIGLSLVSMCINLIQAKLESTYESGRDDLNERRESNINIAAIGPSDSRYGPGLGVFRRDRYSIRSTSRADEATDGRQNSQHSNNRRPSSTHSGSHRPSMNTRACQTLLTFPSPTKAARATLLRISRNQKGPFPLGQQQQGCLISVDDVMTLVDTDEADMVVLTALSRDVSVEAEMHRNDISCCAPDNNNSQSHSHAIVTIDGEEEDASDAASDVIVPTPRSLTTIPAVSPRSVGATSAKQSSVDALLLLATTSNTSATATTTATIDSERNKNTAICLPSTSHSAPLLMVAQQSQLPANGGGNYVSYLPPSLPSLHDIEELEELEDKAILQHVPSVGITSFIGNPAVHFRSRLSLIPEHQVVINDPQPLMIIANNNAITTNNNSTNNHHEPEYYQQPLFYEDEDEESERPIPETIIEETEEEYSANADVRDPQDCDEYTDLSPRTEQPETTANAQGRVVGRSGARFGRMLLGGLLRVGGHLRRGRNTSTL